MPLRTSIDDMNSTLIEYSGSWVPLPNGSTRQWEGSVHSTAEAGAKATFKFRGYQVWVVGTIPAGNDISNEIQIQIDNGQPTTKTTRSNGSAVYSEIFFESGTLSETFHTIVVTNMRSTADGSSEFMLDKFEFEGNDDIPLFAPPGSSTSSSNKPTGSPGSTNNGNSDGGNGGGKSSMPMAAVLGALVGVLVIAVAALVYFLWWRKRKNNKSKGSNEDVSIEPGMRSAPGASTIPVPFHISSNTALLTGSPIPPVAPLGSETDASSVAYTAVSSNPPNPPPGSTTFSEKARFMNQPFAGPFMSSSSQLATSPSLSGTMSLSDSGNGNMAPFEANTLHAARSGTTLNLNDPANRPVSFSPSSAGENPPPYVTTPTR